MRVLDADTPDKMVGFDKSLRWWFRRYMLNIAPSDIVLLLARPTSEVSIFESSYNICSWVLHDDKNDSFVCLSVCGMHSLSAKKILWNIRHLDIEQLVNSVHVGVYFPNKESSYDDSRMRDICQLFKSQLNWIKDGRMEQELAVLGGVQPLIEPIDKDEWMTHNKMILDGLRDASLNSSRVAELISIETLINLVNSTISR